MTSPVTSSIAERVVELQRFFDLSKVLSRDVASDDIVRYYRRSSIGYSIVHSRDGSIHMSLSQDGSYDSDGYTAQIDMVSNEIARIPSPVRVIELGCGRGYNISRLATKWPSIEFVGIDLSPEHVRLARSECKRKPNIHVQLGDFEQLRVMDQSFDLAFSIESLCHARSPVRAMSEIARITNTGGRLMIVDAWRTEAAHTASANEKDAISITEKAMAVGHAIRLSEWRHAATESGWAVRDFRDLRSEVMPNLERFERLASGLIRRAWLARASRLLLPLDLTNNVIAGYLMAQSVRQGFHTYGVAVLEKRS